MRILVLVTDAFGGLGGIAKFNRDLLTALCEMPLCDEVVAITRLMPRQTTTIPDKLKFITTGIGSKLKYVLTTLGTISHGDCFDVIICGHINLIPLAYICKRKLKIPLGLIIHGIDAWQPTSSPIVNFFVKKIQFFVSVSEFTKHKFLAWTGLSVKIGYILPNCVEVGKFGTGTKDSRLLERYDLSGKTILMTLGRLVSHERHKGFDEVLDIIPQLASRIPNIAYLIVGDGSDRQRLNDKANALKIADRVFFTGHISEEEKADHYRLADLYVMPSRGEGFGIVFLEAMACGVPVIGSKLDGSREALKNGELGSLVDPSNKEELIQTIIANLSSTVREVPVGLDYFSYESFKQRVWDIMKHSIDRV